MADHSRFVAKPPINTTIKTGRVLPKIRAALHKKPLARDFCDALTRAETICKA